MPRLRGAGLLLLAALAAGCAHAPAYEPQDPLEPVNRGIYKFNEVADRYVLRPVAIGYDKVTPGFFRTGVGNFFDNLLYPTVIVNDLLQFKLVQFGQDLARLVVNTTIGIGGLLDVATHLSLEKHDEDLGQTFGYWGIGEGWYLVLPLLGPSNNRDFLGRVGDGFTNPINYVESRWVNAALTGLNLVDTRASLLPADGVLAQQLDRYVFVRTLYLERRHNLVHDGNPPPEDLEDYGEPEDAAVPAE